GAFAKNTLGYVAQMQEAGVPVTYAYISDAHDNHTSAFPAPFNPNFPRASGPGEADYKAQLKAYDDAFAAFFNRLAADGINKNNTLFVVTADEGDHFAGGVGIPQPDGSLAYSHANCSWTTTPACPSNQIGEVNLNITPKLPARTPSFTAFGNPDYFVTAANSGPNCGSNPCIDYHFAWSHGDIQPEIATNWLGLVGPGVKKQGIDSQTWTDHTNVRATTLVLAG